MSEIRSHYSDENVGKKNCHGILMLAALSVFFCFCFFMWIWSHISREHITRSIANGNCIVVLMSITFLVLRELVYIYIYEYWMKNERAFFVLSLIECGSKMTKGKGEDKALMKTNLKREKNHTHTQILMEWWSCAMNFKLVLDPCNTNGMHSLPTRTHTQRVTLYPFMFLIITLPVTTWARKYSIISASFCHR